MKCELVLKKKLQSAERVRGRLQGNFGYMRSDEIARVQEMRKKAKTALTNVLVNDKSHRTFLNIQNKSVLDDSTGMLQVHVINNDHIRKFDPEVTLDVPDLRVIRKRETQKAPDIEVDLDEDSNNESSSQEATMDVLVV